MSLKNFNGKTFVAFIDISGFKNMMQKQKAGEALNKFYSIGYQALQTNQNVSGVFISDCGILYHNQDDVDENSKLQNMLHVIKQINQEMLSNNYLLTTSIAYGDFEYRDKIELPNLTKNALQGNAYLDAYLDNANGTPKIKAGECRVIVKDNLLNFNMPFLVKKKSHYYFYWMLNNGETIENYDNKIRSLENKYNHKTKQLNDEKFKDLKQLLRGDTQ